VTGAAGRPGGDTVPGPAAGPDLRAAARAVLEQHWRDGYTVPNGTVYPFQWLWDSCFHALVWHALGEPGRAVSELAHLFRTQSSLGFVPHVDYEWAPLHHAEFWGREGHSSITQPPMFGHAVAELARAGVDVATLVGPARRGLSFLLDHRTRIDGLVSLCHPWESGGDDSPRWDHWCPGGWDPGRWYDVKGELVLAVEHAPDGSPLANPSFRVAAASFNALVAYNALELADVTADDGLRAQALELVDALDRRWDAAAATWVDAGDSEATSGRARTLEALLPVLVSRRSDAVEAAFAQLRDGGAFGGRSGPSQVHRREPSFAPRTYWRGPAWPQLTYLCWRAAVERDRRDDASALGAMLVDGAVRSGWAEYWDADDGTGLGAAPQSWATLAVLADGAAAAPRSEGA
jgi:hypothetical protein